MRRSLRPWVLSFVVLSGCGGAPLTGRADSTESVTEAPSSAIETLAAVQRCLDSGSAGADGRTICELPAGTYELDGSVIPGVGRRELHVSRSNTTLRGAPESPILRRTSASVAQLIFVDDGVKNAIVEGLVLDGNRFAFSRDAQGRDIRPGCFPANNAIIDLEVRVGAEALIQNVKFYNAIDTSLLVGGSGSRVIHIEVHNARSTGVHVYGDDVTIDQSRLEESGTAGVTVHGKRDRVLGTVFFNNRHEQPDGVPGGQLNLEPESEDALVAYDSIDGNFALIPEGDIKIVDRLTGQAHACPSILDAGGHYPLGVDGIEGYGLRHQIEHTFVFHNMNTGMLIKGTIGWKLWGNTVTENGSGIGFLPYQDRENAGVTLTDCAITNNRQTGLSLTHMQVDGAGLGGCTRADIHGNGVNVLVKEAVDPTYAASCR